METFICKICNEEKGKDEYGYRNSYKDRLYRNKACKKCLSERGSENRRKFRVRDLDKYRRQRRESAKRYRDNHPEKHYKLLREWREKQRKQAMELLGELKCKMCGFFDYRALQIDHINGGGNQERKRLKTTAFQINKIRDDIKQHGTKKYQILCANCNWIKRYSNKQEHNRKY